VLQISSAFRFVNLVVTELVIVIVCVAKFKQNDDEVYKKQFVFELHVMCSSGVREFTKQKLPK